MTEIATKRLRLVDGITSPDILMTIASWLNDSQVVQYSEQRHRVHTGSSQLEYVNSFKQPSEFRIIYWIGDPIGTITAHVDWNNRVADMGILIGDKQCWESGFGTEAWTAMMKYLFENGIHKIEAGCMSPNIPMVKIFKKSGMHLEGYRDSHFVFKSGRADMELWAKFNGK